MKYYSEITKKVYDTEEALVKAEETKKAELAKVDELAQKKKERANEVRDAYQKVIEVRKKAQKEIEEIEKKYYALRDKFVEDYGSWHMTYTDKGDVYNDNFWYSIIKDFFSFQSIEEFIVYSI